MPALCPCGSGQPYAECCERLHLVANDQPLTCTPEQLMRSRFSAFALGKVDYLLATLHPAFHEADERAKAEHALKRHQWRGLRILNAPAPSQDRGEVEFVAFCTDSPTDTVPQQLHEHSRFVFENARWWYTDGDLLPAIKLGRNDSCWCGSGKKIKKCHQG